MQTEVTGDQNNENSPDKAKKEELEATSTQAVDDRKEIQPSPSQETEKSGNTGQPDSKNWRFNKEVDLLDTVGTLIGIIALVVLIYQSCELEKTNEIADRSARTSSRAYISVSLPEIEGDILANPLRVTYFTKNTGQTPAYEVQEKAMVKILPEKDLENIEDPHNLVPYKTEQVINPDVEAIRYISPIEEPKSHKGYSSAERRIVVWGKVTYKDVFGNLHWTTFCFTYSWGRGKFTANGGRTGRFNDADKDYEKK